MLLTLVLGRFPFATASLVSEGGLRVSKCPPFETAVLKEPKRERLGGNGTTDHILPLDPWRRGMWAMSTSPASKITLMS
jgi:hypothetical protein